MDESSGGSDAYWCSTHAADANACADFDGPTRGWLMPADNPHVTATVDAGTSSTPPRSILFELNKPTTSAEPLNGLFIWDGLLSTAPSAIVMRLQIYFSPACDWIMKPWMRTLELGVQDGAGARRRIAVRLGPGHLEAWSYTPESNTPALRTTDPRLDAETWIPVELKLDPTPSNPSATLTVANTAYELEISWNPASNQLASVHANFGPYETETSLVPPCSYRIDDAVLWLDP